jgi:hypothetical protein
VNPVDGSVALTTPHVNSGTDLRMFDSDGTETLTQTLSKQYISAADNARFSPDGTRLYVTLNDEDTLQAYLVVIPAGATKAGLSIKGPRKITFGDTPKYSAHLAVFGDVTNLQVRIYTQLVGGPKELFKTGDVDSNGDLFFRPDLTRETLVTAEWDGDGAYLADSLEIDIGVRVAMEPTIRRWYARSGHTYLFHTGSRPIYSVKVRPNESGKEVTFELQSHASGSWRGVTFVRLVLSPTSKAGVSISGLRTGTLYRIQASMHGTGQNLGNHTPWTYLKVA